MTLSKHFVASLFGALGAILAIGTAIADAHKMDYTKMSPEALAEHLIVKEKGFVLDQETQEGGTVGDRHVQDVIQKVCSGPGRAGLTATQLANVSKLAKASIVKPKGGVKLGDWKAGEALAQSGYGYRVGHRTDDHSNRQAGGNCYACHQLDPNEIAYGTLGPSLTGYGKTRGTSEAILNYTYEVIYAAHAYFPCTLMPRFGANGVLSQEQIADVMAYLLDPWSPVNQ